MNEPKFIINAKWWRNWIDYVGFASSTDNLLGFFNKQCFFDKDFMLGNANMEEKEFSNKKPSFINNKSVNEKL